MLNNLTKKIFQKFNYNHLDIEIINECDINKKEKLTSIVNEFFTKKYRNLLATKHLKIIVPKDFNNAYYKNSNASTQKLTDEYGFPSHHGIFILPSDKAAINYTLIIHEFVLDDEYESYKTLFHEFTHFIDYTHYFNKNGNVYIEDINKKIEKYFFEFHLWTEFNAKKVGLSRLKEELDKKGESIDLVQTAINFQNEIVSNTSELDSYYKLSHFLARIAVFENLGLTSTEFPAKWLSILYGIDILKLYMNLKNTLTFKDFDKNKVLLRQLFDLKKQGNYLC